jgi:hypothetical protein
MNTEDFWLKDGEADGQWALKRRLQEKIRQ